MPQWKQHVLSTTIQTISRYERVYVSWKESKTKTLYVVFLLETNVTNRNDVGEEDEEGEKRERKLNRNKISNRQAQL